jgi:hypothetical protein
MPKEFRLENTSLRTTAVKGQPPREQQHARKKYTQLYLNLGQKQPVFMPITCKECGMTFTPNSKSIFSVNKSNKDDDLDSRAHFKYHTLLVDGIPLDVSTSRDLLIPTKLSGMSSMMVDGAMMSTGLASKVGMVMDVIKRDLGSVEISSLAAYKIFLLIHHGESRIVSCIIAHHIAHAFQHSIDAETENTSPHYNQYLFN